jgi:hypothetical protein
MRTSVKLFPFFFEVSVFFISCAQNLKLRRSIGALYYSGWWCMIQLTVVSRRMHWELFPNLRCLTQDIVEELREIITHAAIGGFCFSSSNFQVMCTWDIRFYDVTDVDFAIQRRGPQEHGGAR